MKTREKLHLITALSLLLAAAIFLFLSLTPQRPAHALFGLRCPWCWPCIFTYGGETETQVSLEHAQTRYHFGHHDPLPSGRGELGEHQRFLINYLFLGVDNIGGILPALMMMSQQMSAVAMQQVQMIGAMLDAKHQLESQQLFRELAARAHKSYHPSTGMCVVGTNVRSLATAESHARVNAFVISQRAIARQLGNADVNAADGLISDRIGRLDLFARNYCNRYENNALFAQATTGLGYICNNDPPSTVNADINYTRLIEIPRTIEVDFTQDMGTPTAYEQAVLELATNLFGHRVFPRISQNDIMILANHRHYQDLRAVVAKRGVALHTFATVMGMKSQGSNRREGQGSSDDTAQYLRHLLYELGVTADDDMPHMLGHQAITDGGEDDQPLRPSYMAQMEFLTKRLYQNPQFFADLYDTPANVKRKSAALQSIGLMLDRDIHDSYIRGEMLMSMLLELRIMRAQREVQNNFRQMTVQMTIDAGGGGP